jgi:hypothetical protein
VARQQEAREQLTVLSLSLSLCVWDGPRRRLCDETDGIISFLRGKVPNYTGHRELVTATPSNNSSSGGAAGATGRRTGSSGHHSDNKAVDSRHVAQETTAEGPRPG